MLIFCNINKCPVNLLSLLFLLQFVILMLVTIWWLLNRSLTSQTCHRHKVSVTSVSNIVAISDLLTGSMFQEFSLDDVQGRPSPLKVLLRDWFAHFTKSTHFRDDLSKMKQSPFDFPDCSWPLFYQRVLLNWILFRRRCVLVSWYCILYKCFLTSNLI